MRKDKAIKELDKWRDNPQNVRFERLCIVAEALGLDLLVVLEVIISMSWTG